MRVNLAECCTRRYRVDRAVYRNTAWFASATGFEDSHTLARIESRTIGWAIGGPRAAWSRSEGKIERGCHSAGIRLSVHVVRIYRKIDIGSETMVLPMQRY